MDIGDKVKLVKVIGHYGELNKYIGQIGYIYKEDDNGYDVQFNSEQKRFYCYKSELELVKE